MAQDWLGTLMSGVGGAFTGYGVARDRRMTEAERARLAQRQQQQDALGAFSTQLEQRAALDQLGYRPSGDMAVPRGAQGGMVPGSSVAAMVPTDAIVGVARRGPSLTTPQGESYTLDRLQTPDARRVRDTQMKQAEARAELDRRARERAEDQAFQSKRDAAAQANARVLAGIRSDGSAGNRAQQSLKAKRDESFREAEEQMQMLNDTILRIENNESAFGAKNYLPNAVRMRLPWRDTTADADAIGSLEYVVGELRHGRFGGALTPSEAERASRIFSEPTAPSAAILAQLNAVRRALLMRQRSLSRATPTAPPANDNVRTPPNSPDDY